MMKYAPRTVDTYSDLIRRFIIFYGDRPLEDTGPNDIIKYYLHLKRSHYAGSSIAYMMISLRQFFKYLFLRRLVDWDYQLISVPKYVSTSYRAIEPKDARAMLNRVRSDSFIGLRDKTILSFLYASGLRVSELCRLTLSDLTPSEPYGNIVSAKNRVKRMVLWNKETAGLLPLYLDTRKLWAKSDHLFISMNRGREGGRLSTRTIQRIVTRYRTRDDISPHSYRHGLGRRATKSGIHPRFVQKILGHKSMASQQCYLDVYDGEVVEAYNKIGD